MPVTLAVKSSGATSVKARDHAKPIKTRAQRLNCRWPLHWVRAWCGQVLQAQRIAEPRALALEYYQHGDTIYQRNQLRVWLAVE